MPPAVLALILCLPFYIPTRHATELRMSPFATELVRGCSVTHVPVIAFHLAAQTLVLQMVLGSF